jgi:uncharacterized membrane protein YedE/YeeE
MQVIVNFAIGLLFGGGLIVSGMSDPAKVLGFLDVAAIASATWDPSLAFVMLGAIAVALPGFRLAIRRGAPVFADGFRLPDRNDIDRRVFVGPAIFGIGWGLAGLCPGPALVGLGFGQPAAFVFVGAMAAGMLAARQAAPALQRTAFQA